MLVRSKNLSEAVLAELPEMRAFARLMVNDRHQADDEVAAAITLANKDDLRSRGDLRWSLFAILRKCIVQHDRKPSSDPPAVFPAERIPPKRQRQESFAPLSRQSTRLSCS